MLMHNDELESLTSTVIVETGDEENEEIAPASLIASESIERLKFYISREGEEHFTGEKGGKNEDN